MCAQFLQTSLPCALLPFADCALPPVTVIKHSWEHKSMPSPMPSPMSLSKVPSKLTQAPGEEPPRCEVGGHPAQAESRLTISPAFFCHVTCSKACAPHCSCELEITLIPADNPTSVRPSYLIGSNILGWRPHL